jgi:hypothetical protein
MYQLLVIQVHSSCKYSASLPVHTFVLHPACVNVPGYYNMHLRITLFVIYLIFQMRLLHVLTFYQAELTRLLTRSDTSL